MKIITYYLLFCLGISSQAACQELEPWQKDVEWSFGNSGPVECPAEWQTHGLADCLLTGTVKNILGDLANSAPPGIANRSCAMLRAMVLAKNGACAGSYQIMLLTQCHNPQAQDRIKAVGQQRVCSEIGLYSPQ
ncbi:hypothetical protein [Rhizobium leguminosarum]|uniref:hypothetical protein n=1 Tax=Rhizobium leguminosarum TaxID=384 RepID=UPI003F9D2109